MFTFLVEKRNKMNKEFFLKVKKHLLRFFWQLIYSLGIFSFILLIVAFTDLPYNAYHWLGTSNSEITRKPDVIVLMGGSGMPSPDGLIRTWYTAKAGKRFQSARIIIAHPYGQTDSLNQLALTAHQLVVNGIDSSRIQFAPLGFNTRSQALNVAEIEGSNKDKLSVLLVTSPEHMYRAVKTFMKAGFTHTEGMPAFEIPIDEEKIKDVQNSNDTRVKTLSLRYNLWSYLQYEIIVMREYCAIAYYKIKGWI